MLFPWSLLSVCRKWMDLMVLLTVWTLILLLKASSPLGEKNTTQKHFIVVIEDTSQLLSATAATLSLCVSGRGRKVVDIVLLLQQQHNNKKNLNIFSQKKNLA